MTTSVQAIFVFDGPGRPLLKRDKVRRPGASAYLSDEKRTKRLIQLLGFEVHDAPGEAEAECALLQRAGLVDAVLSEDVDTLMFGSELTLRDWSCEGIRTNKTPTHVSLYDAKATKEGKSGLDREGMILVALMSGGDYDTEGITRCGSKTACEAARAGFGKSLCEISADDVSSLKAWRNNLAHELQTNESGYFRQRNKAIAVPDDFPNREILHYYTHPVISSDVEVSNLKERLQWDGQIDVPRLRAYVASVFEWSGKLGAKKLIRGLAPALLVFKLRERMNRRDSGYGDLILTEANEQEVVRAISGERRHFSTDGIPELRLTYQPSSIVGLDLDAEVDNERSMDRQGEEVGGDEEDLHARQSDDDLGGKSRSMSPTKKGLIAYNPIELEKSWVFRSIAKVGVPLKVEDYEEALMLKQSGASSPKAKKAVRAPKNAPTKHGMQKGALDRYFVTDKPLTKAPSSIASGIPAKRTVDQPQLPPVYLAPSLERLPASPKESVKSTLRPRREHRRVLPPGGRNPQISAKPANPWAVTQSQSSQPTSANAAKVTKSGANQNYKENSVLPTDSGSSFQSVNQDDIFSSSGAFSKKHSINFSPTSSISVPLGADLLTNPLPPPLAKKKRAPARDSDGHLRQTTLQLETFTARPSQSSRKPNADSEKNRYSLDTDDGLPTLAHVLTPGRKKSDLPSLEGSRIPPRNGGGARDVIDLMSSSPAPSHSPRLPDSKKAKGESAQQKEKPDERTGTLGRQKRFIAPRESLQGAWKEYTEEEVKDMERNGRGRQRFWRKSEVEVLDMTEDYGY